MSRSVLLLALLTPACITSYGQKVTVLLTDEEITCVDPGDGNPATASLTLEQVDDFYQVELVDPDGGTAHQLSAVRKGRDVTFQCPDGFDTLIVRHASILQAKKDGATTGAVPAP